MHLNEDRSYPQQKGFVRVLGGFFCRDLAILYFAST